MEGICETNSKKELSEMIGYLDEEQTLFVLELLKSCGRFNKVRTLELSGYDMKQTFDTAYPEPYAKQLRELYPNFNLGSYIFDYSKNSYGELVNVNDLFVNKLVKVLERW